MLSETEAQILTDNGSLSPLPKEAKEGVIAMGILGLFSFISCCFLFIYISYRLLTKHSNLNETPRISISSEQDDGSKIALGASRKQSNSDQTISRYDSGARCVETSESNKTDSNSFLTLIHNLLVADMLQSLAFTFGLNWWRVDGIIVSSGSCGARKLPQSFLQVRTNLLFECLRIYPRCSCFMLGVTILTFCRRIILHNGRERIHQRIPHRHLDQHIFDDCLGLQTYTDCCQIRSGLQLALLLLNGLCCFGNQHDEPKWRHLRQVHYLMLASKSIH